MNYKVVDMNVYKRKDHFTYFKSLANPYVGLTVQVDITKFIQVVKEKKLPFFLTFNYCVARAANSVPEFRQRIMNDGIAEYADCKTSHTVVLEDGTYCYCTLSTNMPFKKYLPYAIKAQEDAREARSTSDDEEDANELLFISSLHWLSYIALSNPTPSPADSNPRITWGKYTSQNGKVEIPVTVLCNHALVDGLHIAQFYQALDEYLENVIS
ncbi:MULTISPECIES: CatA-like O-acetyltransferase [unclassified Breznakia]|uniref:CatA-like O-acetyltransferase n=1 Tax=unclassified Breznakia TaxID=2623764 RepID=UPI002476A39B|nr:MULTISPECIES: CatA-like O-acetyltransferase [unclassified Breznakia]MDH6367507.1 chloramphenicol O-acetyltransferase type A [Breznakia sp. PH1-1]MDH6404627.1 chloramphenicol O-acetyltransferase type A [Breznakia sp. PF1-11]MDH6412336.1 chloramphenicol O-acetyltransferase type A [Breznakia sp. PFB1-11]MDH6414674.1 chloramphenicol O-acetyltransferase type A [Breznakia sp. PFB1-14]MDH6416931.1 chloramphenicol O-acetyltransferase type A [Breznakia sp. PFB1-4]